MIMLLVQAKSGGRFCSLAEITQVIGGGTRIWSSMSDSVLLTLSALWGSDGSILQQSIWCHCCPALSCPHLRSLFMRFPWPGDTWPPRYLSGWVKGEVPEPPQICWSWLTLAWLFSLLAFSESLVKIQPLLKIQLHKLTFKQIILKTQVMNN